MDLQKEREAFEKWFATRYPNIQKTIDLHNDHESIVFRNNQAEAWQAAKAQAVPKWISVKDEMPEQGQKVLVFRPHAHEKPYKDPNFKICTYVGADVFINSHFEHTITHWKPITAPVEAQEQAND